MKKGVFYLFAILMLVASCSKPQNDGVPTYVSVQNITLQTQPGQGTSKHGITTLWAESQGENFGAHELPIVFPALVSGNRQFIANAGIQRSGDFFFREIYPLYTPYNATLNFTPGDTIFLEPVFEYRSGVQFIFIEDFESSNAFSELGRTSLEDENNLEGRAAFAFLDENNTSINTILNNPIVISRTGRTFVELHYKGTNDLGVGIEGFENGASIGANFFSILEPTPEWRKVHLDITNILNGLDSDEYKFFIRAALLPGLQESNIYIDNFQIVKL